MTETVRLTSKTVLADDWGRLTKFGFDLRRRDGEWQAQTREVYDRGNGAVCLLFNEDAGTVLLTRQFRLPAFVNAHDGYLIEAPAGILDGADPITRIKAELEEETGYAVDELTHLYDVFMSPGSVSEYLAFFVGSYSEGQRRSAGGGDADEGEDIEVLEVPLESALAMISSGEIRDAKTIMLLQHLVLTQHKQEAA